MRGTLFLLLPALIVFTSMGTAQDPGSRPAKSTRFTPDQIKVLEQVTYDYLLNGEYVSGGPFDVDVLAKTANSEDPLARALSEHAIAVSLLKNRSNEQGKKIRKAFEKQIEKWPEIIATEIVRQLMEDERKQLTIADAVKLIERMMGNDGSIKKNPQDEANAAWLYALNGLFTETNLVKPTMRKMAVARGNKSVGPAAAVKVTIGKDPKIPQFITIENTTKTPLENCLILVRLQPDHAVIEQIEKGEASAAALLRIIGFSPTTWIGASETAILRNAFLRLDKGSYLYVPFIPARGTVTATVAFPPHFLLSKGIDVSLWCDAWSLENIPAEGWKEARAEIAKLMSGKQNVPNAKVGPKLKLGESQFQAFTEQVTWEQAKAECVKLGGRLAIVTSAEQNEALTNLAIGVGLKEVWLGGTDRVKEGKWMWVDGTEFRYVNWDKQQGQPNNKNNNEHYLILMTSNGRWADQPVAALRPHRPGFICEWPAKAKAKNANAKE